MVNHVHAGLKPATRLAIVLLTLSPLALAVPAWMREEPEAPASPAPLPARQQGTRLTIDELRPIAGFAINAHHISDLSLYLTSVDRIAELGANALIVFTPMIQRYVESNEMTFVEGKCATDEQLVAILARGRERGLHTTLLPIVFIERPDEDEWRGVIEPSDWETWWVNYDRFIDRFVDVANQGEADMLIIGSELNSTEEQLDRWKRVADRVRAEFKGQIAYSANWDRYDKIKLWPLVDVMCVSSYFELVRDDPKASEGQLVRAWSPQRSAMLKVAQQWDKPLLLSEVGYPSVPWASAHPWNYVIKAGSKADHEAQAKCWRAFFRAWTQTFVDPDERAAGFFGYCWSPYYHGDDWDTGYGIEGKPAHEVVKNGFAVIRAEGETHR
ncbi:MAG: hypothetical protein L0Y44_11850 [Phycisphaerales bacterium]|nr:hypothetical protein [Phycisphaerales bacterium]MCI0631332.1 hypothetical protein [Phycisphaerales bacterium]